MNDEISSVRVQAAKALWQINPQDSSFVKVLQECLTGDKNSRYAALSALGECPSIAQEFLQPIIEALSDSNADHSVRRTAAEVLGKLGERGKTAVPALLAATKHQEPEMREAARDALKAIDPSIDVRTKSQ